MDDEEFERWKQENGWHFTEGDFLLIVGFIAFMWIIIHFSQ